MKTSNLAHELYKKFQHITPMTTVAQWYNDGGVEGVKDKWEATCFQNTFYNNYNHLTFSRWCVEVEAYDLLKFIFEHPNAPKDRLNQGYMQDHLCKGNLAEDAIENNNQDLVDYLMQWPEQVALLVFYKKFVGNEKSQAMSALAAFDAATRNRPDVWDAQIKMTLFTAANNKQMDLLEDLLGSWCSQCGVINCSHVDHPKRLLISETTPSSVIFNVLDQCMHYSKGCMDETGSSHLWAAEPSVLKEEQADFLKMFATHPVWKHVYQTPDIQKQLADLLIRSVSNADDTSFRLFLNNSNSLQKSPILDITDQNIIMKMLCDLFYFQRIGTDYNEQLAEQFIPALDPCKMQANRDFRNLLTEHPVLQAQATRTQLLRAVQERRQTEQEHFPVQRKI